MLSGEGYVVCTLLVYKPPTRNRRSPSITTYLTYLLAHYLLTDAARDELGLKVLDEPSASQSDSTVLELQLRAISKKQHGDVAVRSIENAAKVRQGRYRGRVNRDKSCTIH